MENELTVKYIFESIEKIADKIGLTAKELWPFMVKQASYEGMSFVVFWVVAILISLFVHLRYGKFGKDFEKASDWRKVLTVVPFVIYAICLIGFVMNILKVINPEYYAFGEFMKMIK